MNKRRDYIVDILKFIFALLIVLYHSKNLNYVEGGSIFLGGVIAVEFFFIVSGYYLAKSAMRTEELYGGDLGTDTAHFMWRRICGFMPNYFIAWVIAFVVNMMYFGPFSGDIWSDLAHGAYELMFLEESGIGEGGYIVNNVTWYVSALLLSMLVLYPLIKKYRNTFFYVIAPILFIFLFGVMSKEFINLKKPYAWVFGIATKGMIRAMTEVTLGCIVYRFSENLRKIRFTWFVRTIFTLITIALYTGSIMLMYYEPGPRLDFDLVFVFALALLLTTSPITWFPVIYLKGAAGKFTEWLGELSFSVFLGHGFWSQVFNSMYDWGTLPYDTKLKYYLGLSFGSGLFIMYLSRLLRFIWKKSKDHIMPIIVKKDLQ